MEKFAEKSKQAAKALRGLKADKRKSILLNMAQALGEKKDQIIEANRKDLKEAETSNLSGAMKDRLLLNEDRIEQMIAGVRAIAEQPEVVGAFSNEFTDEKGLQIKRQRIPLGVILMIFESRPNVVVDCAALAIKSSNAIILKGGKEAKHSNEVLGQIIQDSISGDLPVESVQVLASDDRKMVSDLLSMDAYIDVVIPRGGEGLIRYVYDNAKMPVIAHFQGLCHMYIDQDADLSKALKLVVNAKTQRTGVCNAIESLLVHEDLLERMAKPLTEALQEKGTELRVDEAFKKASGGQLALATEEDWKTEYLDNILSIKTVKSLEEAISHIDEYGTQHSECIVSENKEACDEFMSRVDASCIMVNASTRFNDGGQLGLGAELGISTTKLHAYGPMGAEQMTTTRYVVVGEGHIRE